MTVVLLLCVGLLWVTAILAVVRRTPTEVLAMAAGAAWSALAIGVITMLAR